MFFFHRGWCIQTLRVRIQVELHFRDYRAVLGYAEQQRAKEREGKQDNRGDQTSWL